MMPKVHLGLGGLRLLLCLQLLVASASSASSSSSSPRSSLAFRPRRGGGHARGGGATSSSSSSSSSTLLALRRKNISRTTTIRNVGLSRRKKTVVTQEDLDLEEDDYYFDYGSSSGGSSRSQVQQQQQQQQQPPSLDELRAQLGPIGILTSSAIELVVTTAGSYISGAMLGYVGGSVMGIPSTLLGKDFVGGFSQRLSALHAKAFSSCKSWATLSAAFSGSHNFVRLCRGGNDEDGWNQIWGSFLAGAFLNRTGGPQAMVKGGASYAGFTYFIDKFMGSPSSTSSGQSSELLYDDVPLYD